MIKIRDVIEVMEQWAPHSLAESWDNVGLITGNPYDKVAAVIITLEVTGETMTFSQKNKSSMIISHHPETNVSIAKRKFSFESLK